MNNIDRMDINKTATMYNMDLQERRAHNILVNTQLQIDDSFNDAEPGDSVNI